MAALQQICINGFCSEIDLSNYYTRTEVDTLINAIDTGRFEVVQELPTTGEDKVIYLVPNEGEAPNIYDEYIWVNDAFEKIGTTEINLDNYYTKTETDDLLDEKQNTLTPGENIQIQNGTISATDTTYGPATTTENGLMSAADKEKIDGIEDNAEKNQNAFSNVTVGGVTIAASEAEDTITLIAGDNVTLTPDASGKSVTVGVTLTRDLIMEILGVDEVTISKTDANGTVSGYFLGSVSES